MPSFKKSDDVTALLLCSTLIVPCPSGNRYKQRYSQHGFYALSVI